jgi:metal-dependent HD superfamily phosphatase/phosphodiesterase
MQSLIALMRGAEVLEKASHPVHGRTDMNIEKGVSNAAQATDVSRGRTMFAIKTKISYPSA